MLDTLRREFGDTASFVLKDPRLSLTFPAWLPALQAAGADVRVLIALRHPAEVVQSVAVRNRRPQSETAPHWLHHMLEAERASRGLHRAVVSYDDLMRGWRRCMAEAGEIAGVTWPRPIDVAAPDIDVFLATSSRHHQADHASAVIGRGGAGYDQCGMDFVPRPGQKSRGFRCAGLSRSDSRELRGLATRDLSAGHAGDICRSSRKLSADVERATR